MIKKLNKPILITGPSGFIGSQITRKLLKKNNNVHIIIRKSSNIWRINDIINQTKYHEVDITNKSRLINIVSKIKPYKIFHLATYGAYSYQNELDKIKHNILDGTSNLLEACLQNDFKIFINTGSNSEYGFSKKKMEESDLLKPNSYYGIFKAASTMLCNKIALEKNKNIITLRPFHVYGPYEEKTRLIPVLINSLLKNKCPPLVSPKISRDMIYIDDVVDFYLKISNKHDLKGQVFNIGSGKSYTIEKIFYKINQIIKSDVIPKWSTMRDRSWDQEIWISNMNKSKKILNFRNKVSLERGIKKTIKWIKNNKKFYNID